MKLKETEISLDDVVAKFEKAVGGDGISLLKREAGLLVKGDKVMLIFNITLRSIPLTPEDVRQLVRKKVLKKDFVMRDGRCSWKRGPFDMVHFLNATLRAIGDQVISGHDSEIQKERDGDGLWFLNDARRRAEAEAKALEDLLRGDMAGYILANNHQQA